MNRLEDQNGLSAPRRRVVSLQTTNERGGAEYANVDLLETLAARGHEVVLMTNLPEIAAGTQLTVREIDLGPKLSRGSVARIVLLAPLILARLARALYVERPVGTLLLHFKKEQLLCSLLPSRLTGMIVWAEWGPLPPQMRRGPARWAYALAARRARSVMAVSQGTVRTLVEAGVPASRVELVPSVVDAEEVSFDAISRARLREQWGVDNRTLVVGCVSRFQRRKRNDVIIDALAHLDGDVLLVLAGEGEQEDVLRARAAPYGDRVRFAPSVRGHVQAFLSACDLLVFAPSPTEGEPRAIVLAQLVGVPVIATDSEGAEGLIAEGGGTIVSPSHDPTALAATIDAYRVDPESRLREGYTAREKVLKSHDTERTLKSVERVFGLSREPADPISDDPADSNAADDEPRASAHTRVPDMRRVWRTPSRRSSRRSPAGRKRR
jgi:glycosyltransferase involved in cell wall biosynthesis